MYPQLLSARLGFPRANLQDSWSKFYRQDRLPVTNQQCKYTGGTLHIKQTQINNFADVVEQKITKPKSPGEDSSIVVGVQRPVLSHVGSIQMSM